MSKESLRQEDTTGSTYIDLGATTAEAYAISHTSRLLARRTVGNDTLEDRIRQRCSVAVGDFDMAGLLRFQHGPVEAGLDALSRSAPIFTDIRMVEVGIQKRGHHSQVTCVLDRGAMRADREGITRTSAGFLEIGSALTGSIVVIGNAPSALLSVCQFIRDGIVPALVVGTPVGFVNAQESKEELRNLAVPSVSNVGTRGGTPVAVAAINEIITMYSEMDYEGPGH
jgi:precorrin-8X/cobalt-precorrin-8 methylmutase